MNPRFTGLWLTTAIVLFAFIGFLQFRVRRPATGPQLLLPALRPAAVTELQLVFPDAPEISVQRLDGVWQLNQPFRYPAQGVGIEALLDALHGLTPDYRLYAAESNRLARTRAEYGLVKPLMLVIQQGPDRWQISIGHRTAPGDQVYLQVGGATGLFVAKANWLKFIPRSADEWRDTALVDADVGTFDRIIITNGPQVVELRRDARDHLWRMTRPFPTRANNERIADSLQRLQTARVARFVTDNPETGSAGFGLQPAHLNLWFGRGTNAVTALFLGRDATRSATDVFGRRLGGKVVFTTAAPPLSYWWARVNAFRDRHLLEFTAPVAAITVQGPDNFTLKPTADGWQIAGETFPVDSDSVQTFIQTLAHLRISEFVDDVATPQDLTAFGLDKPAREITVLSTVHGTNAVMAQLLFGAARTNQVFVRRADEDSLYATVYAVTPGDFNQLPWAAWQFRERRIWHFSNDDVATITIRQGDTLRRVIHQGLNQWSLAPGSQGIINPPAFEEIAYRLGRLDAVRWMARDATNAAAWGFRPGDPAITVGLKNGRSDTVVFGGVVAPDTPLAAVTLEGKCWIFALSPALDQLVRSYLAIPASVP